MHLLAKETHRLKGLFIQNTSISKSFSRFLPSGSATDQVSKSSTTWDMASQNWVFFQNTCIKGLWCHSHTLCCLWSAVCKKIEVDGGYDMISMMHVTPSLICGMPYFKYSCQFLLCYANFNVCYIIFHMWCAENLACYVIFNTCCVIIHTM